MYSFQISNSEDYKMKIYFKLNYEIEIFKCASTHLS